MDHKTKQKRIQLIPLLLGLGIGFFSTGIYYKLNYQHEILARPSSLERFKPRSEGISEKPRNSITLNIDKNLRRGQKIFIIFNNGDSIEATFEEQKSIVDGDSKEFFVKTIILIEQNGTIIALDRQEITEIRECKES